MALLRIIGRGLDSRTVYQSATKTQYRWYTMFRVHEISENSSTDINVLSISPHLPWTQVDAFSEA